jgi:hypothetical protein
MRTRLPFFFLIVLLSLAVAVPAGAQSLSGTVSGVVKDEQGGVLPGVTVVLKGKTGSRTTTTDAEGAYRFPGVDPGTYSVNAELAGFRPKRQDNVDVSIGKVTTISMALAVGGVTESLEVVGESPVVDVGSSATDNNLSQEMLFNLPIRPDNAATDLLDYLPGINNGVAYGGNQDYGSALLLDGVDTRDPEAGSAWTFFNYNIIDEVQVGGLGAPAEYGTYTGAIVNTVTKSGGNRFSGLFDAYWTKASFSGDNVTSDVIAANPSLAEASVDNKRLDLTAQLGGPIIQDKLFFFLSAERFELDQNPAGPRTIRHEVSPRINTKITWQPSSNDNVSFTFQADQYNVIGRPTVGSNLDTDQTTVTEDAPELVWGLQWRHLFGPRTFAEVKYTGWTGYYYLDPESNIPLAFDGSTNAYSGGAWWYYWADRGRNQVNASISHYAEAFGKHDLKFGIEIERSKVRSRYGYNSGLYYYDYTAYYPARQYYAYGYGYDIQGRNQRESLYAQDSWKPTDRLTINAGVRVDFDRGRSPVLDTKVYSTTNWAPRIGFAYDLTGDGKTVLKGHYGQYYEGMYFSQYEGALPGIQDYITYAYDPQGSVCGPLGNCFSEVDRAPTTIARVDPNIKHPRVDEWTAGIERELAPDVRLSVTGIWRQDKNIQGAVYPDARWNVLSLTTDEGGADPSLNGIPVTAYEWANQAESEGNLLLTNVDGFQYLAPDGTVLGVARPQRKYKSVMVVLDKRFSNRWQGRVSYVWSRAEGSIGNNGSLPDTFAGANWTPFWQTPTIALVNTYGRPVYDRTNELKVMGTYQVPKIDVGLNAYYRYLTGTTYTAYQRFSSSEINYPKSAGRSPFIEPRGSHRLGAESYLDLRLEKIFPVGRGGDKLTAYVDIQNVFNAGTVIDANSRHPNASVTVPQPDGTNVDTPIDFGAPTELAQPRRFIIGGRWSF